MHQWKVPLKYGAMLLFPSGPLGLEGAADTMVWVGVPTKWREQKSTSTHILKLCRNSTGCHIIIPKHPLVATATAVAAARRSPPPQPRSLRGFIIIVVAVILIVIVIVTAITTVFPPLLCDRLIVV